MGMVAPAANGNHWQGKYNIEGRGNVGDALKNDVAETERFAMQLGRLSRHDFVPFLNIELCQKGQCVYSTCYIRYHLNVASLLLLSPRFSYITVIDHKGMT